MNPVNPAKNGFPCWTDLCSTDPKAAESFYGELFGWTFSEPQEEFGCYQRAYKDNKTVAGMFPLQEGMTTSVWTLYFQTDDAEKTSKVISENDGTIITPAMTVGDLGTMVVASDSTGATFGLWQPNTFSGAEIYNESGALSWDDLRSNDPDKARNFYSAVFNYRHDDVGADIDYKSYAYSDGQMPLGGIGEIFGGPETPSHWEVTFRCDDAPKACEIVKTNGGNILNEPVQTPFGRAATVVDPFGGAFTVIDQYGVQAQ